MLDFTDKKLFDSEKGKYNKFLKKKLETKTEYNENLALEDDDDDDFGGLDEDFGNSLETMIGGDSFDIMGNNDSFGDFGGGFGDFGNSFGGFGASNTNDTLGQIERDQSWESKKGASQVLWSLPAVIKNATKFMMFEPLRKDEWDDILTQWEVVNIIFTAFCGISLALGFKYGIISVFWMLIINIISLVVTEGVLMGVYRKGFVASLFGLKPNANAEPEQAGSSDFGFGDFGSTDEGVNLVSEDSMGGFDGVEMGSVGLNLDDDSADFDFGDFDDSDDSEDDDVEDLEDDDDSSVATDDLPLSNIVTTNEELFYSTLLETFANNVKYSGKLASDRKELLNSFKDYLITGTKGFGKYTNIRERSTEYNNISYVLFKALEKMYPQFARMKELDDKPIEKFTVMSIKSSPIIYIVEAQLPSYVKEQAIVKQMDILNNMLKSSPDDTNVSVIVESFSGRIVFKLLRLDAKAAISFGDILRFKDGSYSVLDEYSNPKLGMPILVGLKNNEYPTVIDFEANTSGVIVGGSGSGKSWTTFSWMWNFVLANSPKEVQFIILDMKDAMFWKQFAIMPHVIGIHGKDDFNDFITILKEVDDERLRRQKFLQDMGQEDVKGARKALKKRIANGDKEAQKLLDEIPLITVIIDEITYTMTQLLQADEKKEMYNEFRAILSGLTATARSAGIRILQIGQRAVDTSIAKNTMANSSLKFGMRMDTASDFTIMFGKDIEKVGKPSSIGMGLISAMDGNVSGTTPLIKTLTLGVFDDSMMGSLIRIVAIDWLRRVQGNMDLRVPSPGSKFSKTTFNRNIVYEDILEQLKEGRILNKATINKEYAFDLENMAVGNPYERAMLNSVPADFEVVNSQPLPEVEDDIEEFTMEDAFEDSIEDAFEPTVEDDIFSEDYLNELVSNSEEGDSFEEDAEDDSFEDAVSNATIMEDSNLAGKSLEDLFGEVDIPTKSSVKEAVEPVPQKQTEDFGALADMLSGLNSKLDTLDGKLAEKDEALAERDRQLAEQRAMLEKLLAEKKQEVAIKQQAQAEAKKEKVASKGSEIKQQVSKNSDAKVMDITMFIRKYGTQTDTLAYKMPKEELAKFYNKRKIQNAIMMSLILEDGEYYMITMA